VIVQGSTTTCTFNNSVVASRTITFTVTVRNDSLEAVNLLSLEDSENPTVETSYASLSGSGTCNSAAKPFGSIAGNGGTYSCTFSRTVSGTTDTTHNDKVRAVARDDELNSTGYQYSNLVTVTIN
jgi:hypothetical protein